MNAQKFLNKKAITLSLELLYFSGKLFNVDFYFLFYFLCHYTVISFAFPQTKLS